jgi:hypothetical protein
MDTGAILYELTREAFDRTARQPALLALTRTASSGEVAFTVSEHSNNDIGASSVSVWFMSEDGANLRRVIRGLETSTYSGIYIDPRSDAMTFADTAWSGFYLQRTQDGAARSTYTSQVRGVEALHLNVTTGMQWIGRGDLAQHGDFQHADGQVLRRARRERDFALVASIGDAVVDLLPSPADDKVAVLHEGRAKASAVGQGQLSVVEASTGTRSQISVVDRDKHFSMSWHAGSNALAYTTLGRAYVAEAPTWGPFECAMQGMFITHVQWRTSDGTLWGVADGACLVRINVPRGKAGG